MSASSRARIVSSFTLVKGTMIPETYAVFAAWDLELKAAGLNPGTSADFTVAALFLAGLVAPRAAAR